MHRDPPLPVDPIAKGDSTPARAGALSLLTLPAEIRNCVYAHLSHHIAPLCVCVRHTYQFHYVKIDAHRYVDVMLGLILPCRQLYHEAMSVFYMSNTFLITG